MKTCFKCKIEKPLSDFYVCKQMADGRFGKCKECYKIDVVTNRAKNLEYYQAYDRKRKLEPERLKQRRRNSKLYTRRHPTKRKAQGEADRAVKKGILVKGPCEVCGDHRTDAHHDDYGKPLEVRWLCVRHHHAAHRKYDYDLLLKAK